ATRLSPMRPPCSRCRSRALASCSSLMRVAARSCSPSVFSFMSASRLFARTPRKFEDHVVNRGIELPHDRVRRRYVAIPAHFPVLFRGESGDGLPILIGSWEEPQQQASPALEFPRQLALLPGNGGPGVIPAEPGQDKGPAVERLQLAQGGPEANPIAGLPATGALGQTVTDEDRRRVLVCSLAIP